MIMNFMKRLFTPHYYIHNKGNFAYVVKSTLWDISYYDFFYLRFWSHKTTGSMVDKSEIEEKFNNQFRDLNDLLSLELNLHRFHKVSQAEFGTIGVIVSTILVVLLMIFMVVLMLGMIATFLYVVWYYPMMLILAGVCYGHRIWTSEYWAQTNDEEV